MLDLGGAYRTRGCCDFATVILITLITDLIKELSSLWHRYLNSKYQVHRT
jgi:hypothetical protein